MFSASGAPARRHRRGDGSAEAFAILQDEEQPDRDDDQSQQEAGGTQERRQIPDARRPATIEADTRPAAIDASIVSRIVRGSGSTGTSR